MNGRLFESRQTSHAAIAQMVVMSAQNNSLRGQRPRSIDIADNVLDVDRRAFDFLLEMSRPCLKYTASWMQIPINVAFEVRQRVFAGIQHPIQDVTAHVNDRNRCR